MLKCQQLLAFKRLLTGWKQHVRVLKKEQIFIFHHFLPFSEIETSWSVELSMKNVLWPKRHIAKYQKDILTEYYYGTQHVKNFVMYLYI